MDNFMHKKRHINAMNSGFLSTRRAKLIGFGILIVAIRASFHKKKAIITQIKGVLNCKIRLNLFILHKVRILPIISKYP